MVAFLPGVSGLAYWDDAFWPRQLPFFVDAASLLQPPPGIPDWPYNYFRPVWISSLLLDASLYSSPLGGHWMNLGYHAATVLLIYLLAKRLVASRYPAEAALAAALAAGLFAVHPIHAESICWVGARVDILATLFCTLTLGLALRWRDRGGWLALLATPLAYLLALGSKEVGIVTAVLVPLALLLTPFPQPPQSSRRGTGPHGWCRSLPSSGSPRGSTGSTGAPRLTRWRWAEGTTRSGDGLGRGRKPWPGMGKNWCCPGPSPTLWRQSSCPPCS